MQSSLLPRCGIYKAMESNVSTKSDFIQLVKQCARVFMHRSNLVVPCVDS